ncbi:ABC transporter substrate-binding protein [Acuticoccus sp. I52.16.1]|uniref:ABC transporter substrate-binding protein n=1 Tax=Acuticoccus sp. I52.16.1 TaxID=2928472 RepID=UPI001FD1D5EE|nr:ABC transporter substrate-binding protein [Acuticoccus sp. I52.16.1]UOM36483.1 ABC transporter substrate-binding protein [Acuticoccus sp. I52.16.1]
MRRTSAVALGIAWAGLAGVATPPHAEAATLSLACSALGIELRLCTETANQWARETGHTVEIVSTPNSATERLALYQQILSAGGDDIDVYQIDVIWPGLLGEHFVDLRPKLLGSEKAHFPALIESSVVDGELKAIPWFADAGLLYYRADLLEKYGAAPPATWAELTEVATTVMDGERAAGQDEMWGYVFQGRAYEGLTCNALEWVDSFGGGTFVDGNGEVTADNPQAVAALETAAGWIGTITPTGVLNYSEEESRSLFQSGNAVFMRNWPYAYALANSPASMVNGRVDVTALPRGGADGSHTGTLGGQLLAVSRYSRNPDIAINLVRYLTSRVVQQRRATEGGFIPTIPALYEDEQVRARLPYLDAIYETFSAAVARPSSQTKDKYNRVSNAVFNAVHTVLSGEMAPAEALSELDGELNRIKRRGW